MRPRPRPTVRGRGRRWPGQARLDRRLNLPDGEGALERWRRHCTLYELTPDFAATRAAPAPELRHRRRHRAGRRQAAGAGVRGQQPAVTASGRRGHFAGVPGPPPSGRDAVARAGRHVGRAVLGPDRHRGHSRRAAGRRRLPAAADRDLGKPAGPGPQDHLHPRGSSRRDPGAARGGGRLRRVGLRVRGGRRPGRAGDPAGGEHHRRGPTRRRLRHPHRDRAAAAPPCATASTVSPSPTVATTWSSQS